MKLLMVCLLFCTLNVAISGCASDKSSGTPTPIYATYYIPVLYPAYSYAPVFDQYYNPGPYNDNFNYYGYYAYWGSYK